jgi:hypothetical protein
MTLVNTNIDHPHLKGRSPVGLRELTGKRLLVRKGGHSFIFHFDRVVRRTNSLDYSSKDGFFLSFRTPIQKKGPAL